MDYLLYKKVAEADEVIDLEEDQEDTSESKSSMELESASLEKLEKIENKLQDSSFLELLRELDKSLSEAMQDSCSS